MARELVLDTSALVSLLDRSQTRHADCVTLYRAWTGPVVSTEAVLTEATHLLSRVAAGRATCIEFFLAGGVTLAPTDIAALRRAGDLVRQYDNVPMDFADATLVVLADELGTETVFTLDTDFDIYRRRNGSPFRRLPG